ncbi:MAG: phage tail protein [Anaerovibrio sp.]|nr:phage tail protein [Anaerovibrio sp.]
MTKSNIINSPFIGLQGFHVAKLIDDPKDGTPSYEETLSIPHIQAVQIKATNSNVSLYADNQSIDTANVTSEYELTFNIATLPLEYKALLLGHKIENGVVIASKDDVIPYFAVMFESTKRNGKKRFCKFLKVQFLEPDENPKTKEASIAYNTPTISAKAIYRTADGIAYKQADEEAGYTEEIAGTWYSEV